MRRIEEDRCGYINGYTCSPIKPLGQMFKETPTDILLDGGTIYSNDDYEANADWVWVYDNPDATTNKDGTPIEGETSQKIYTRLQASVDNYIVMPQIFEGFVMTMENIIDMSGDGHTREVPELSCRTNMDPFTDDVLSVQNSGAQYTVVENARNTGLMDMYNNVYEVKEPVAYTDPVKYTYPEKVYSTVSGNPEEFYIRLKLPSVHRWESTSEKPVWKSLTIGPGLLEPMLDTMFPPIGVDTITGPDTIGDFTVWLFDEFNTWKGQVDARLRNMYQAKFDYSKINGLLNLENAKNQKGPCDNFQIQLVSTAAVIGATIGTPTYAVSGGTVRVEDEVFEITGATMYGALFDSYIEVWLDGSTYTGMVFEVPPGNVPDSVAGHPHSNHVAYEYIGSVRKVTADDDFPEDDAARYSEYVIHQDNCIYEITLGGGTGGGTCSCKGYQGPFKVVGGTTTNQVSLIKFDPLWATEKTITGYVMNGEYPIPAPVKNIDVSGIQDIWAHIDVAAPTVTYYTEDAVETTPTQTTTTNQQEEEITDFVDVRLARVSLGGVQYTTVTLPSTLPSGATLGSDSTISGSTVTSYSDFARLPVPTSALEHIAIGSGVSFDASGTVYEVYGGTLTGNYCVAPANGTCSYSVYATQEVDIKQIQHGDIVLGSTATQPQVTGSTYSGPFTVTVDDGTATIKCDDCWYDAENEDEITGYYSINGGGSTAMPVLEGVAADTGDYVYLQFSTGDPVLSTSESTSPGVYNVLLARVTGATSAAQLHYGNIHVDGRWS